MKIPFTLNNESIVIDAPPDEKLLNVLRRQGLTSVKCACNHGSCGTCAVLVDDKPIPSCILPVAAVREKQVMTFEGFTKLPEYRDIADGFKQAKVRLCGYCNASKYFAAYEIINENARPPKEQVLKYVNTLGCRCTDTGVLTAGIARAAAIRRMRLAGEQNVKN